MKEKIDELSQLLSLILQVSGFSRLRLYVVNPTKNMAILRYAMDLNGGANNIASRYSELHNIPLNLRKLHKDEMYDMTSYKDFIARFRDEKEFVLKLNDFKDVPPEVRSFHNKYGIEEIFLISLWASEDNFIGYIAVDKSLAEEEKKKINKNDEFLLTKYTRLMQNTILSILNNREAQEQQAKLLLVGDEVMRMLRNKVDVGDIMKYLFASVFRICEHIDILQIKQITGDGKFFKYLYIEVSPNSNMSDGEREKIKTLIGEKYAFDDNSEWLSNKVYTDQTSQFVADMRKVTPPGVIEFIEKKPEEARLIILKRNCSEVNIPFMFGGGLHGIIDVHGKRPYALNKNTMHILRDMTPWFTIILNEMRYNVTYDFSALEDRLGDFLREKSNSLQQNIYINNYYDSRDVTNYINYENHKKLIEVYKRYVDGELYYRRKESMFGSMQVLSFVALPLTLMTNIYPLLPFLSIMGIISAFLFKKMAKKGREDYESKYMVENLEVKKLLKKLK